MQSGNDEHAALRAIGWRGDPLPPGADALRLVRVIAQHRNGYRVHDGTAESPAQPAPRFLKRSADPVERPAVGDFVLAEATTPLLIREVLPRRTVLSRAAAGERFQRQIIAANIDTVFVVMGLDGDFNPRRIERYLALIQGSGARAVIVLTKRDKLDEAGFAAAQAALDDTLSATVERHAVNAKDASSSAARLA